MEKMILNEQTQYAKSQSKKGNLTTIKFPENPNNKLYGKYFTHILPIENKVCELDICDIELKGKGVMIAKCISMQIVKFHELNELTVLMCTGLNYGDSLVYLNAQNVSVTDFECEVKYCLFESMR